MAQTSREIVNACLKFEHPDRMPCDVWTLPWAEQNHPDVLRQIWDRYPDDFGGPGNVYKTSPRAGGNAFEIGESTDEWGCVFVNIQRGVHGEVREPIIKDIADRGIVQPPYETLPDDLNAARDEVNRNVEKSVQFIKGGCCPRPWERYQFLRGTENAMMDMMMPEEGGGALLKTIHEFYLKEYEFWVTTDVDGMRFMDDWGSQQQLLIPPSIWRELFKPLYKDYCDLAHAHGKPVFMHSDGYIAEIYEDLIEVGVDAINSQLFCMDMAEISAKAKGKITFWGEIDRQHVLTSSNPQDGRDAVRKVAEHFYDPAGGIIVEFELGPGFQPETALAILDEWDKVQAGE